MPETSFTSMTLKGHSFICLLLATLITAESSAMSQKLVSRHRRHLTYPDPSTLLLIFGLGTPLQLDRESIILGAFTKIVYNLPTNATDFEGLDVSQTRSRWNVYKTLERVAELSGFSPGKACLLKSICQVAAAPFDSRNGLLGQIVQVLLTPSSTSEAYENYQDREYHAAERLGRGSIDENCNAIYPECRKSFLHLFTVLESFRKEFNQGRD